MSDGTIGGGGSPTHFGRRINGILVCVIPVRGLSDSSQLVPVGHSFQSYYTVVCPKGLSPTSHVKIIAYTVVQRMSRASAVR